MTIDWREKSIRIMEDMDANGYNPEDATMAQTWAALAVVDAINGLPAALVSASEDLERRRLKPRFATPLGGDVPDDPAIGIQGGGDDGDSQD